MRRKSKIWGAAAAATLAATSMAAVRAKEYLTPSFGEVLYLPSKPTVQPRQVDKPLKILVWNIHEGRTTDGKPNISAVEKIITEQKPDVTCLQEATAEDVTKLHEKLGMSAVLGVTYKSEWRNKEIGNAVLTPYKIIKKQHATWMLDEGRPARGALGVTIDFNGLQKTLVNTHLDSHVAQLRTQQAKLAYTFMKTSGADIGCGDYNAVPSSETMQTFTVGYKLNTCNRQDSEPRIEGLLRPIHSTLPECTAIPVQRTSDHTALVFALQFPAPAKVA